MNTVIARAPGRVNVIGEHTDYTGGFVFPMAIELGVTAQLSKRADQIVSMRSKQLPGDFEFNLSELTPGLVTGWAAYVAGAVWAVKQNLEIPFGIDISIDADLPLGAGMSSSAAVECSVILALVTLLEKDVPMRELARWAKRAENEFVGVPTGSMDQVASLMSKADHLMLFDTRDDVIDLIPIDLTSADATFVVIDTRSKHELTDGSYAQRRDDCEEAAKILQVKYLRDITDLDNAIDSLISAGANNRIIQRLRHVVTENQRVLQAVAALKASNLQQLGDLINQSHASLRDDFEVSCPELNLAVSIAIESGAFGARMMGGGFGGSTITLISNHLVEALKENAVVGFKQAGYLSPKVYLVTASEGAKIVSTHN